MASSLTFFYTSINTAETVFLCSQLNTRKRNQNEKKNRMHDGTECTVLWSLDVKQRGTQPFCSLLNELL